MFDDKSITRAIRKVHYLHPSVALLLSPAATTMTSAVASTSNNNNSASSGSNTVSGGGSGAGSATAGNTTTTNNSMPNISVSNPDSNARATAQLQAFEAEMNLRRQLRMGVDNSLYVYPTQLERFKHRYLYGSFVSIFHFCWYIYHKYCRNIIAL